MREIMTSFDFSKSINCLALTSKCPKASFILETNNFETGKLLKDFTRCLMYQVSNEVVKLWDQKNVRKEENK